MRLLRLIALSGITLMALTALAGPAAASHNPQHQPQPRIHSIRLQCVDADTLNARVWVSGRLGQRISLELYQRPSDSDSFASTGQTRDVTLTRRTGRYNVTFDLVAPIAEAYQVLGNGARRLVVSNAVRAANCAGNGEDNGGEPTTVTKSSVRR